MRRSHAMPFGAELRADGATRFRLWAPAQKHVHLELESERGRSLEGMRALEDGWHELVAPAPAGTRYRFVLESGLAVPDPASRANPDDVHAPSAVVDPRAFDWQDGGWKGRPWNEAVIYELHVGTFTPEGTFAAAAARLEELAALGVTAIELMPLAEFPGRRNWGYDGVLHFAPEASYGTPEDLKRLVQAAHARGLMVLIDVVYNHFGPEGNYLNAYAPQFFDPGRHTPWGAAIAFEGPASRPVRDFFLHNALYWVEEYGADGLRLDAVHAIRDGSRPCIVEEIRDALAAGPGRERHVHVVLENDANDARFLEGGRAAQWNDDVHHALHLLVTGETDGYYSDYAEAPVARLARALAEGFAYQGEPSAYRGGARRGEPSGHLPATAFVSYLQTHDQVGNRAFGERIARIADPARLRAAHACVLLSPQVPMLFMGEEFAASSPFLYFCDFGPDLAEAVRRGRREEFARFAAFSSEDARRRIPDPGERATFESSKLRWEERAASGHREHWELTRELLEVRARAIAPRLAGMQPGGRFVLVNGGMHVEWTLGDGARLHLAANFGAHAAHFPEKVPGEPLWQAGAASDGEGMRLEPAGVAVHLERP